MVILYRSILNGAEVLSDAFPAKELENGQVFAVKSEIVLKSALKLDMGDADEVEDKDERVNNVGDTFQYTDAGVNEDNFMALWKDYIQSLMAKFKENKKSEDEIKKFQEAVKAITQKIKANLKKYEFFNVDYEEKSALIPAYWEDEENDKGPTFLYFTAAFTKEKV